MKEMTIQELYDQLYLETAHRCRLKGDKLPTEMEIFEILYKELKEAILRGDETTDALEELKEVKSFHIREEEAERRKQEVEDALRQGYVIDLDVLK